LTEEQLPQITKWWYKHRESEIYQIDWIQSRWQVEQLGELLWTQHLLDDSRGHCRTFKHTRLRVRSIMHEILICVGASWWRPHLMHW